MHVDNADRSEGPRRAAEGLEGRAGWRNEGARETQGGRGPRSRHRAVGRPPARLAGCARWPPPPPSGWPSLGPLSFPSLPFVLLRGVPMPPRAAMRARSREPGEKHRRRRSRPGRCSGSRMPPIASLPGAPPSLVPRAAAPHRRSAAAPPRAPAPRRHSTGRRRSTYYIIAPSAARRTQVRETASAALGLPSAPLSGSAGRLPRPRVAATLGLFGAARCVPGPCSIRTCWRPGGRKPRPRPSVASIYSGL